MNKFLLSIFLMISGLICSAQVEMADDFRGEGKIYVVITIILILLLGFFSLLIKLDRRTKRLEKELKDK